MKLVKVPRSEGEEIAINTENIEAIVPKGERSAIHMLSGKVIGVELEFDELIQALTMQGWRKS
ncbi:MAG TPA: hypothetical protein VLA37_13880 [Sphingomonadaceae bacterium]|nr:hypothetical protein [Sphingomonadaceae bacterium]